MQNSRKEDSFLSVIIVFNQWSDDMLMLVWTPRHR